MAYKEWQENNKTLEPQKRTSQMLERTRTHERADGTKLLQEGALVRIEGLKKDEFTSLNEQLCQLEGESIKNKANNNYWKVNCPFARKNRNADVYVYEENMRYVDTENERHAGMVVQTEDHGLCTLLSTVRGTIPDGWLHWNVYCPSETDTSSATNLKLPNVETFVVRQDDKMVYKGLFTDVAFEKKTNIFVRRGRAADQVCTLEKKYRTGVYGTVVYDVKDGDDKERNWMAKCSNGDDQYNVWVNESDMIPLT